MGQFPCLTAKSYMILTDSHSSSAIYPIWTCTSDCDPLSSSSRKMIPPRTKKMRSLRLLLLPLPPPFPPAKCQVHPSVKSPSVSSSATSSGASLCGPNCSSRANIDPPSSTPPPKVKRHLRDGKAPNDKRMLDWPQNFPYNGDMNLFIWWQWNYNLIGAVSMR